MIAKRVLVLFFGKRLTGFRQLHIEKKITPGAVKTKNGNINIGKKTKAIIIESYLVNLFSRILIVFLRFPELRQSGQILLPSISMLHNVHKKRPHVAQARTAFFSE